MCESVFMCVCVFAKCPHSQRHSYNRASLDDLVRRHVPAELVDEVLPVARAGNVLVPEQR